MFMRPSDKLESTLFFLKRFIPKSLFSALQPIYHYLLALTGAIIYRFPSKKLFVIGVTGTKGKSTTSEMINAILEEAGLKTALIGTIRIKIDKNSTRNKYKMTAPGRFVIQEFLSDALKAGCTHAVIEMSSEMVPQFRHRFIYGDALVFTNLTPEHIDRHGSFENYRDAKLQIAKRVLNSGKDTQILVVNKKDEHAIHFKKVGIKNQFEYSIDEAKPFEATPEGSYFTWHNQKVSIKLPGEFNIENALASLALANAIGIKDDISIKAIEKFEGALGRAQKIEAGQNFTVVVDYAHTTESLEKLYQAFPGMRKICVLGGTGGGRDTSKRPKMGAIASRYCDEIILTNEDPYDEDPRQIVDEISNGISNPKMEIIMDRREAIRHALKHANRGSAVLISGKGTDPYIMEANGKRTPWDDATVAKEELEKILK